MTLRPTGRPPFRADHVGSLLRPAALRQAFKDHLAQRISDDAFRLIQDASISDVVKLQEETGLEVVTDGEFRRASYWGRFVERTEGFVIKPAVFKFRDDHGHEVDFTAPYATGRVQRTMPLALDEFTYLRDAAHVTPKITIPSPSTMHFYRCTDYADPKAYPDVRMFFTDLASVYQQEIADLARAGCRYVQIDEVAIALLCDPDIRAQVEAAGQKPDTLVELYIDALNDAIAGAPSDMIFGVHMCRGNFRGHYLGKGGYESVAEHFFTETRVNHFLLEYDTPRAGDFAPLRFVRGKGVVLGLISTKTPTLEDPGDLKRRIEEAAKHIDLDRLAIGPQCGFASTVAGNPLTEADERAKLSLAVSLARAVWH